MHQDAVIGPGPQTRRRTVRAALLSAVVMFALPVSADAPTDGPDRQYENFTANDKVITDHFTQLVWDRPSTYAPVMS
jgi:hypothetical protein